MATALMRSSLLLFAWALAAAAPFAGAACASTPTKINNDDGLSLGAGAGGFDPNDACALYELTAVEKPVNLFVLMDRSSSMAGGKWDSAEKGLAAFVNDPKSAGLNVALGFFPRPPDMTPVCDPKPYQQPTVSFAPLPGNAVAIQQAIGAAEPDGFGTPMYPALGGALLEGIALAKAKPGSVSAVLLVTDGVPDGPAASCGGVNPSDPSEVAKLAATGAMFDPPVVTYVVGLPGIDQSSSNLIAAAGGTDAAILVVGSDVAASFNEALGKVRGDVLPCRYDLPQQVIDGEIALTLVNIQITHGGDSSLVPYSPSCTKAGWKYDALDMATAIELCPSACAALKADELASITVLLGCGTLAL